jgi:hypothetical protein
MTKYMSEKSRKFILCQNQNSLRAAPQPRKRLVEFNDLNCVNDVIDLNQRKLDSGLSKISSHDFAYKDDLVCVGRLATGRY